MDYEDLTVQLGPQTESGIQVRAWRSSGGEATGRFKFSIRQDDLISWLPSAMRKGMEPGRNQIRRDIGSFSSSPRGSFNATDIGHAMFESIFSGEVKSLLDRSLGSIEQSNLRGLRIRLKLDLRDESQFTLNSLPWELLYRFDTDDFLGLSRLSPIVRYLDVPTVIRLQPLPKIFRILVLAPETAQLSPLDLEAERANLKALQNGVHGLEIEFLRPASLGMLRRALLEQEFQALHFMGHGGFNPKTGEGSIFLDGPDGAASPVSATALATVLRDFRSVQLVVLNACNTGKVGAGLGINPFSGIAPSLVRTGIPVVLAMQLPISDWAAIEFSEAFYRRLCAGDPADAAVTEGRQAIHSKNPLSAEWAIPALFMRVPDGVIFRIEPDAAASGRSAGDLRSSLPGIDHLRVGNYEEAIREVRQTLARDPGNGRAAALLGIALARGKHLSSLPYQTAAEMHRLFSASLTNPKGEPVAAAALAALKVDYFQRNSVRELPPSLEQTLLIAARSSLTQQEREMLDCLIMTQRARNLITALNEHKKRSTP